MKAPVPTSPRGSPRRSASSGSRWIPTAPGLASRSTKLHLQPYGIVHGGVYASLAESLTSAATYQAVKDEGRIAMGQSNDTAFLRPMREGTVTATAVARHRGSHDLDLGRRDEGRLGPPLSRSRE